VPIQGMVDFSVKSPTEKSPNRVGRPHSPEHYRPRIGRSST
jgi:hypothetical protein